MSNIKTLLLGLLAALFFSLIVIGAVSLSIIESQSEPTPEHSNQLFFTDFAFQLYYPDHEILAEPLFSQSTITSKILPINIGSIDKSFLSYQVTESRYV